MIVYGDILFLINFSMDYLCLFIAFNILHIKAKTYRLLTASILGSAYSVLCLFVETNKYFAFAIDIGFGFVMCLIAMYSKKEKILTAIKFSILYFLISWLLGGMMTFAYSLLNKLDIDIKKDENSIVVFSLLAIFCGIFSIYATRIFKSTYNGSSVVLEFEYAEQKFSIDCLVDSGNSIRDPVENKYAAFISLAEVKNFLDRDIVLLIERKKELSEISAKKMKSIGILPTKTLNGESISFTIPTKNIKIIMNKGKKNEREKQVDILISPINIKNFNGYPGIIPSEILI